MRITQALRNRLSRAARTAASRAYAPYSKFQVGAAVVAGSGKLYAGCNVENASYGLCNCAERSAIFSAVSAGESRIECVVVYTPTETATPPCGACRQVINEFGPHAIVISLCDSEEQIETSLDALLPAAFGPGSL